METANGPANRGFEMSVATLKDVIEMLTKVVAENRDWLATYADNADHVIVSSPDYGTGLRVLNSISATEHEFNFSGLGRLATGFTREKAVELLIKWEIRTQFPKAVVMRKIDFVKQYIEQNEEHLANFKSKE